MKLCNQLPRTILNLAAVVMLSVSGVSMLRAATEWERLNWHSDTSTKIDSGNVAQLNLAWKIATEKPVTHRPLIENGRVYFADWSGHATAADAKTGKTIWRKAIETPNTNAAWHGFAGTGALGVGVLFEASGEGNAFAVDAQTGDVKWKVNFVPREKYAGNIGAILFHDGLVYIGVSSYEEAVGLQVKGFEPQFRGRVLALDARTGKTVWTTFLVEAPANGVAVWSSFAIGSDPSTLFVTTGNSYSGEATPLSDAIVALDAKTGKVRWSRQLTAHDVWTMPKPTGPDYDFGAGPQLFQAGGRRLVGAGQKSGVYHALDQQTGEVVWQATIGYGEIGGGIMADGAVTADRIFVWSNNSYEPSSRDAEKTPMTIKALDAATGATVWALPKAQAAGVTSAGFLSRDVYFVGSLDGQVCAYSAKDGKKLWSSPNDQPSVGSSLTVAGDTLYFGGGVPKMFGGKEQGGAGVFAYSVVDRNQ